MSNYYRIPYPGKAGEIFIFHVQKSITSSDFERIKEALPFPDNTYVLFGVGISDLADNMEGQLRILEYVKQAVNLRREEEHESTCE